ncbi:MAG: hypothetical protein K2X47_01225, partial [Bdellovibrionales bacterium]|nr:hypothetical protein [Bdellovibrionales bacterium]
MNQSQRTKAIVLIGLMALALGFQNCSRAIYQLKGLGGGSNSRFNGALGGVPLIQILGGATVTNTVNITLEIQSIGTDSMYITSDSTCSSGGAWITQTATHPYVLPATNAMNFIYGKFRDAALNESACVSTQILHDDLSPTIQYVTTPPAISPSATANFSYLGADTGTGLSHYECRHVPDVFATCNASHTLNSLPDGNHTFEVRAVDNAGNRSAPLPYTWLVDTTKPTVIITSGPSALSSSSSAQFEFQGNDGAGSGIDHYRCAVDGVSVDPCTSPHSVAALIEGNHIFDVWAIDRAGNVSDPARHAWEIDSVVPGDFMVTGVTAPPVDTRVDNWL